MRRSKVEGEGEGEGKGEEEEEGEEERIALKGRRGNGQVEAEGKTRTREGNHLEVACGICLGLLKLHRGKGSWTRGRRTSRCSKDQRETKDQ